MASPKKIAVKYDASSIKVYKGLDGVRKTPTVYVNETNENGIFKIFGEAVDNAIDEANEGHGKIIQVVYDNGYIWVKDEGRGLPVDMHKKEGINGLELILTQLNAGGKSEAEGTAGYKKATFGIFGMGVSVTNALSSELQAWSYRDGTWHTQEFKKGKPVSQLTKTKYPNIPYLTKVNKKAGTIIRFKPDKSIFDEGAKIDLLRVKDYLDKASYLNKGLKLYYASKKGERLYYQPNGLIAYLEKIVKKSELEVWGKPFQFESDRVNVCMQWTKTDTEYMNSLVNSGTVKEGGTHVAGFNKALMEAVAPFAGKRSTYKVEDLRSGLVTILNFSVKNPKFSSQVKDKLITAEATADVYEALKEPLKLFFSKNKSFARDLVKRSADLAKINEQATMDKKAKASFKSKKTKSGLPAKLSICTTTNREEAELFLVEGDSAAGSAVQARDSKYHAILRLRGKVLNVYGSKGTTAKIFANDEIKGLLATIGYNPDKPNDFKFNYGRIIIMADEDPDGPLAYDTRILTLDGSNPKIGDVYKNWDAQYKGKLWVWGRKDSSKPMVPVLVTRTIKVMQDRFVRITLDDGTVFDSTRKHAWIIKENGKERRVKASELRKGDSLPAVFLQDRYADGRTLKEGERSYKTLMRPWSLRAMNRYDPASNHNTPVDNDGWPLTLDKMLHHLSFEHFNPKEFKRWQKSNSGVNGGVYHIHHKDDNGFNNEPSNLHMLEIDRHRALHGAEWVEKYNGSERHLKDLENFRNTKQGKKQLKEFNKRTALYNKSQANKDSTVLLNKDKGVRSLQVLGRYVRKFLLLQKLGLEFNEKNWNIIKSVDSTANCSWIDLEHPKATIIAAVKPNHKPAKQRLKKQSYPTQGRSKFLAGCFSTIKNQGKLDERAYEQNRRTLNQLRNPKWSTGFALFNNDIKLLMKELSSVTETTNHKVVKVEHIKSKNPRPYFCLEIPETTNFYIQDVNGNGVITGNSHISTLVLSAFQKLVPHAITEGRVYILRGSLYTCEYKKKRLFADTLEDILKLTNGTTPKDGITRLKGWGEAEPEWLEELAFNQKTRKLIKILPSSKKAVKKYITLVQDGPEGVAARCELVGIL